MTKNEQISNVMGWVVDSHEYHILLTWDDQLEGNKWQITKLLQQRMVDDFYCIHIEHDCDGVVATAMHPDTHEDWPQSKNMDTEPAAIVELFCCVYEIK